jgi:hypothetical protein
MSSTLIITTTATAIAMIGHCMMSSINSLIIVSAQARMAQVTREVPIVPTPAPTPAVATARVIGVAESKGRCIGELPTDVIVPNTFKIAKSWSATDVPLDSVTYSFDSDVARELDSFVLSQCYTSDGLEKLLAHGMWHTFIISIQTMTRIINCLMCMLYRYPSE